MNPRDTNTRTTRVLTLVGAAAVVCFFIGLILDHFWLRMVTKPLPVICLALWVYRGQRGRYNTLISGGLLLSALGDILLEWGESTFLAGVIAFLFAHILYTGAFLGRTRALKPIHAIPFAVWGILVYALLYRNLDGMTIPVAVYVIVICTMMWRAAAQVGTSIASASDEKAGALGAASFGFSDTLIALNRWYAPVPYARYFIMILYWLGQFGIALSTRRRAE
jgi:uncharacterized membrane protein YhhN